jgi:hypothetical protein
MKLLKQLFRNAGIPTTGSFEHQDRWQGMPDTHMTFVDDPDNSGAGAGGGGDGKGGSGEGGDDGKPGKSGQSSVSDTEAELLREVMDKKKKLRETNDALSQATAKLAAFDGVDVEEFKTLKKEKTDREAEQLAAKGQWDALKQQMASAHAAELTAARKEATDASTEREALKAQIAELTVGNSFGNSKFIADELSVPVNKVRKLYGAHFEFTDGAVVGYDKPAGEKGRVMLVDGSGNPLSFEKALEKIVDADPDKDSVKKSKLKTGAGSGSDKKTIAPEKTGTLSAKEKIAAGLKARTGK